MKTTIVKSALLTVETSITAESIKILKGFKPSALELRDDKGEVVFTVATTDKEPNLSDYGIVINPKRLLAIAHDKPLTEEIVREKYGIALMKLKALEDQIVAEMAALEASVGQVTLDILD